ncbi:hypothetical protein CMV_027720 [Castanea mollissima]|uniref:CobW/HypB/UreG nucleotide-binding domain-containing protein n=1 Tax=Castanea mollissima TaxID=60419 RepID=A0A8J4Q675_9ROSI|nr:hypothetical protein CMV_027720 [Castanea mollissima]
MQFGEVDIDGSLVASHSSISEDIIMGKKREVKPGSLLTPSSADGVVNLVDSKHAMQHLNEVKPRFVVNEVGEQVAYADRIIFNKVNFDFLP